MKEETVLDNPSSGLRRGITGTGAPLLWEGLWQEMEDFIYRAGQCCIARCADELEELSAEQAACSTCLRGGARDGGLGAYAGGQATQPHVYLCPSIAHPIKWNKHLIK